MKSTWCFISLREDKLPEFLINFQQTTRHLSPKHTSTMRSNSKREFLLFALVFATPFWSHATHKLFEMSVQQGCLLWWTRCVPPVKINNDVTYSSPGEAMVQTADVQRHKSWMGPMLADSKSTRIKTIADGQIKTAPSSSQAGLRKCCLSQTCVYMKDSTKGFCPEWTQIA